jgi:diguanylate cyclase (GGDEF)-like protein/PAS domain S-box-containing protein
MAMAVSTTVADQLRQTATDAALHNVETIVRGYVDPTIDPDTLSLGGQPDPAFPMALDRIVQAGDIRIIYVWSRDGRVVYSTDPSIQGRRLSIYSAVASAFAGDSVAVYGHPADDPTPIHPDWRPLEIYVPIRGAVDGDPIGVYEVIQDATPIEDRVEGSRQEVFLVALIAASALLGLVWLAFAGASNLLGRQNRLLRQRAATEQLLLADVRRSEERFRSLIRNASDCILIARADTTVAFESPAVERVLGYAPTDRIGRPAFPNVHPDDMARLVHLFADVTEMPDAQATANFRVLHADGSWRALSAVSKNLLDDPAVRGIVVNYRDVTDARSLEEQLRHQAFHDALTGLPNRALFMDRLEHARSRGRGHLPRLAVVFVDLDDFKAVNDSLGHGAGDRLLVEVADRISGALRDGDTAARMGGDEFAVLLEDTTPDAASEVAERLLEQVRRPFVIAGQQVRVHATAGVAVYSETRETAEELLRNADVAMYLAKAQGKDRFAFFRSSVHEGTLEQLQLKTDLPMALERGEFRLVYQPVAELGSGAVRGVEALVRWDHPRRGPIGPAQFIGLAEETGVIVPLGRWVLREACRQAVAWMALPEAQPLTVSVNLSPRQVADANLVSDVMIALRDTGLRPECLTLEITESALMQDAESTTATLQALKAIGLRLAIDDFGTGYSSLSYLRRFPVDILKIDRSFVATLDSSDTEAALVRSILSLGRTLELETIAEGIEREGQLRELQSLGAHLGQGYFFARPLDADAITALVRGGGLPGPDAMTADPAPSPAAQVP